jgi:predicted transcriptional regulator
MRYALVMRPARGERLDLETFARLSGMHPDLIRRLVALDVLDAERDTYGGLWFWPAQISEVGRIRRLRSAFALNYASLGLVCDLLDRIAALESAIQHQPRRPGERSWT